MSTKPSLRRRLISGQSVRMAMPASWLSGMGNTVLTYSTSGVGVTASATANTVGSWQQIISNTAIAANNTVTLLQLGGAATPGTGIDNSLLMDVGIGAAGSETVVVERLAVNQGGIALNIPVRIPGATRIALRARAATGSRGVSFGTIISSGELSGRSAQAVPTSLDVLGTNAATSTATAMSGASGSWIEIIGNTTQDYQALILFQAGPASAGTGQTQVLYRLDMGIGASGSEVQVATLGGLFAGNSSVTSREPSTLNSIYGGFVPAGTRIAVRHNLAANPERITACVIGVPYA